MSKKKPAAKKVAKKTTKKKVAVKAKARNRASARQAPKPTNRTAAATIFVYNVNGETRVRTSPQLLPAGPGYLEWTVVNLHSDDKVDVEITWPDGSPWGGHEPIWIKGGNARIPMAGAKDGRYKYNVTVNGYTEDPEVEIPEL